MRVQEVPVIMEVNYCGVSGREFGSVIKNVKNVRTL